MMISEREREREVRSAFAFVMKNEKRTIERVEEFWVLFSDLMMWKLSV